MTPFFSRRADTATATLRQTAAAEGNEPPGARDQGVESCDPSLAAEWACTGTLAHALH